jgi:cobalt-zinc-cadmium efflux system protein
LAHFHPPEGASGAAVRGRLGLVLAITALYAAAEVIGGLLSGSLALLADAGHMLTDIMALTLALVAARLSRRPADPARTYGYKRVEILAALFNGVALVVIALFILLEAWERLFEPREIQYGLMGGVALGGLVVNVIAAWLLHAHQSGLNVRAAYLHVLGDLLGSIGTLLAAGAIWLLGWLWADAAISFVIGGVIIFGAVRLVLESVNVLMEGAPAHLDTEEVRACLLGLDGVSDLHDLHLWSLGGDAPLLTAHLVLDGSQPPDRVLRRATRQLRERFGIDHSTLQLDPHDYNVIESLTGKGDIPI